MAVGFKLRQGERSRAYNLAIERQVMDLTAEPGGPDGDNVPVFRPRSITLQPAYSAYMHLDWRRYGRPHETALNEFGVGFADAQGPHSTDFEADLITIADSDPGWFARTGNGAATGSLVVSPRERRDAQMSAIAGQQVKQRALELRLAQSPPVTPPVVVPPVVVPPPIGAPPVVPGTLSAPEVRVEELRSLAPLFMPSPWNWAARLLSDCWPLTKPFAVEALRAWRLFRVRHLGDTRT